MSRVLVTGCAGFIGFHTCLKLLARGDEVLGIDNLNDYYDPKLKEARLNLLLGARDEGRGTKDFRFQKLDIADRTAIADYFARERPERVVHLAAQPGVRYSIDHPHAYADSNLVGFLNILEGSRHSSVEHLVYASSSSVYGANQKLSFSVEDAVDHPVSLYGATKRANELMAYTYSHLFNLPTTGLRFFTVYGPWGRPDMAYFSFTKAILEGRPIDVFNNGKMKRDFTYIDDIVEGVIRVLDRPPSFVLGPSSCSTSTQRQAEAKVKVKSAAEVRQAEAKVKAEPEAEPETPISTLTSTSTSTCSRSSTSTSACPYKLYNIGNHTPVDLLHFIEVIEKALGKKAVMNLLPMQPGDVPATFADVDDLIHDVGFAPSTPIEVGIKRFVNWYRGYYEKTGSGQG
jgi:UDP-glucuronate 4-epimerase